MCWGVPSSCSSVRSAVCMPAARAIDSFESFRRATSPFDNIPVVTRPSVKVVRMLYRSSALGYGSGLSRTALSAAKIAVVAPMPTASVAIAATGTAGARRRLRSAKRMSCSSVLTDTSPLRNDARQLMRRRRVYTLDGRTHHDLGIHEQPLSGFRRLAERLNLDPIARNAQLCEVRLHRFEESRRRRRAVRCMGAALPHADGGATGVHHRV